MSDPSSTANKTNIPLTTGVANDPNPVLIVPNKFNKRQKDKIHLSDISLPQLQQQIQQIVTAGVGGGVDDNDYLNSGGGGSGGDGNSLAKKKKKNGNTTGLTPTAAAAASTKGKNLPPTPTSRVNILNEDNEDVNVDEEDKAAMHLLLHFKDANSTNKGNNTNDPAAGNTSKLSLSKIQNSSGGFANSLSSSALFQNNPSSSSTSSLYPANFQQYLANSNLFTMTAASTAATNPLTNLSLLNFPNAFPSITPSTPNPLNSSTALKRKFDELEDITAVTAAAAALSSSGNGNIAELLKSLPTSALTASLQTVKANNSSILPLPNLATSIHQTDASKEKEAAAAVAAANAKKEETNILQFYEPRFCSIYDQYQLHLKDSEGAATIVTKNIRDHLLALCLDHMIPFCCWARENPNVTNWIKTTLDDNIDLRPEVRNGISMILMYCFSAAQAKQRKDSDMFIALQDTETGLGIVNKTSLKIYNDPYQYFNFIKSCITGLIDAGKIPENERINKPKKNKPQAESKEEIDAFYELKKIIIEKLLKNEIEFVKEKILQISNLWYRRQVIRTKRFVTALAVFNAPMELTSRTLSSDVLPMDIDLSRIVAPSTTITSAASNSANSQSVHGNTTKKGYPQVTTSGGRVLANLSAVGNNVLVPDSSKKTSRSDTPSEEDDYGSIGNEKHVSKAYADGNQARTIDSVRSPAHNKRRMDGEHNRTESFDQDEFVSSQDSNNGDSEESSRAQASKLAHSSAKAGTSPTDDYGTTVSAASHPTGNIKKRTHTDDYSETNSHLLAASNAVASSFAAGFPPGVNQLSYLPYPYYPRASYYGQIVSFPPGNAENTNLSSPNLRPKIPKMNVNTATAAGGATIVQQRAHQPYYQPPDRNRAILHPSNTPAASGAITTPNNNPIIPSITVYRYDRISLKEWKFTEMKIFTNLEYFIFHHPSSIFYLINETKLSTEERLKKQMIAKGVGMISLSNEFSLRNAFITSWYKPDHIHLYDLLELWLTTTNKEMSLLDFWYLQHPKTEAPLTTALSSSSSSSVAGGAVAAEEGHQTTGNGGSASTANEDNEMKGKGIIIFEQALQIGLVIRKNEGLGLTEDCWRMIYLSDLQLFAQQYLQFNEFLIAIFPQLLPIFSSHGKTNEEGTGTTTTTAEGEGSSSENPQKRNRKNFKLPVTAAVGNVLLKYYSHPLEGPVTESPQIEKDISYQTIGLINESTEAIFSRFSADYVFHDIILQVITNDLYFNE